MKNRPFNIIRNICFTSLFVIAFSPMFLAMAQADEFSHLTQAEKDFIGDAIYKNECNSSRACLVAWNDGEGFASLGIGHFIWFPKGAHFPFQESFPSLVQWLESHGVKKPQSLAWLNANTDCPWRNKQDLTKPESKAQVEALRRWLEANKSGQATFILNRLVNSLDKMLQVSTASEKKVIQQQFKRVAALAKGGYILADYVNFKGEGSKKSEQYQGQGWGLRHVLLAMKKQGGAAKAFRDAAKASLMQRVALSPKLRQEDRWLQGWFKRIDTYQ